MKFEITLIPLDSNTRQVRKEIMEFISVSEAERYCSQHSNRNDFLNITKVIREGVNKV